MDFEMITPVQLEVYVENPDALIIDLREPEEYMERHIRGAVNIPYEKIKDCGMFPMDVWLVFYCERGSLSLSAAKELAKKGYMVKSVVGGLHAYRGKKTESLKSKRRY
ncbi:MAG: rhodanese-like domain-containing protein [Eubacteriales bacterium]|nr:rhodanese-like domain-containing protein [Eubacteriales bacterium]